MPGTNARGHKMPLGTETSITRATIFEEFGESIRDIATVATVTARTALVAALAAAGETVSATRPLTVLRLDAPGLSRIEYSVDGTVFVPANGMLTFASTTAMGTWTASNSALLSTGDSAIIGVDVYVWNGTAWTLTGGLTRRYRASAMNLTSSQAVIDWNTADTAPSIADFTYSGGVFTAVAAGRFRIHAQVTFATTGSAVGTQIAVRVGTTDVASSDIVTSTSGGVTNHVHRDITLAAGDTVQIQGSAGSTVALAVAASRQSFVEIVRL